MKIPNFLYRGDKFGNVTLPERHCVDGLHSKLIQKGNPAYITKYGIYKAINAHIFPQSKQEISFHNSSHFLSFSESIEKAKYYASDKNPNDLIEVQRYTERRYLFTFNLGRIQIEQISDYVFKALFRCNRNLIEPLTSNTPELFWLRNEKCKLCEIDGIFHTLMILNVVSILKKHPGYRANEQALINAERDKEWLVLPYDYDLKLGGFSAKIPPADFWSTKYFRLSKEKERQDEELNLGMII